MISLFQGVRQIALLIILVFPVLKGQAQAIFRGKLIQGNGSAYAGVSIKSGTQTDLAKTDSSGRFEFDYVSGTTLTFFGYVGEVKIFGYRIESYTPVSDKTVLISAGSGMNILPVIDISGGSGNSPFVTEIKPRDLRLQPTTGGIEGLIKTLGASSSSELSSQYSVRGGNYDENLVYVNDIEIYRPQLISSGQQEGLSFINPDLVKNLRFSAGGFEARYGDKMSSVLDVDYVQPDSFSVIANAGMLLNSVSIEGKSKRVSAIGGVRYFSNSLLTRSLDTRGAYRMNFADAQTLISVRLWKRWRAEFLGNVAINRYNLVPESRQTEFGTVSQSYQLDVAMAGSENMNYDYGMGALTLKYNIDARRELKWIFSVTGTSESELFDVEGGYLLSLLDRDFGSKTYGKPLKTLGFGYFLDHGRNRFRSSILNFSHIGSFSKPENRKVLKYGIRINRELISDVYKEWRYNDSNGYNIPPFGFATDSIVLQDWVSARNNLESFRVQAFVQQKLRIDKSRGMWLNLGLRAQWWQVNNIVFVTPRMQFSWEPNKRFNKGKADSLRKKDVLLKLAGGGYFQNGYYRELRDFNGRLNRNLQPQKSWQALAGMDRYFFMWRRRFKLSSEAYFKQMSGLVPYLYDNIRVRYYAQNSSRGCAWGLDNRINGEFIKGLESWFTLSVLQTRERITYTNDAGLLTESAWLRRPTDRRVNFAAVIQDQLPGNPDYRINLNLIVGTGMPYFLDGKYRYTTTPSAIPAYRRLDIGFSKVLLNRFGSKRPSMPMFKGMKEAWISLEVFNILGINNVISYNWVKDIENNVYGVPEYLTSRRLNLRLHLEF